MQFEKPDLEPLYCLLEELLYGDKSAKTKILEQIESQEYKPHSFAFRSIANDLKVILGKTVDENLAPVESDRGKLVKTHSDRIAYIKNRLLLYATGEKYENIPTRLFDYETCRIKFKGNYIQVKEFDRIEYGLTIVKDIHTGELYADYIFPKSFVDITDIHRLTNAQTVEFENGRLDLQLFYESLVSLWFSRHR